MLKYSVSAILIANILTIILLIVVQKLSIGVVFISLFATAYIINFWFSRTKVKEDLLKIVSIY